MRQWGADIARASRHWPTPARAISVYRFEPTAPSDIGYRITDKQDMRTPQSPDGRRRLTVGGYTSENGESAGQSNSVGRPDHTLPARLALRAPSTVPLRQLGILLQLSVNNHTVHPRFA